MRVQLNSPIQGLMLFEIPRFGDERGFFCEIYNQGRAHEDGLDIDFVQDNMSRSAAGVLRGLHYQWPHPQGKLVTCTEGELWDVAVDLRQGSSTFGQWHAEILSAENRRQFWIPAGFAHGFAVIKGPATLVYKCDSLYIKEHDKGVRWNDPDLGVDWPVEPEVLSAKDASLPWLKEIAGEFFPHLPPPNE